MGYLTEFEKKLIKNLERIANSLENQEPPTMEKFLKKIKDED